MVNWHTLTTTKIRELAPYQPGKPIKELQRELGITDVIKLASNENPLGPSPKGVAAAQSAVSEAALYPDGSAYLLKSAIAKKLAVHFNQITLGNGSDEIFRLIIQAFSQNTTSVPNEVICSEYAFLSFPIAALSYGCEIKRAPCVDFTLSIHNIIPLISPQTRIIYIDNPNNPTGTAISQEELIFLLSSIPSSIIVILDEAYYEYIQWRGYPKSIALLARFQNLIVTRTFSKAYGLAGLRSGYSISHSDIAEILNRIRLPFNVNVIAQTASAAALEDDEYIANSVELNTQEKNKLAKNYDALGLTPIPSHANFITVDMKQPAFPLYQKLLHRGIIVRPIANYNLINYLRISVGEPQENERLIAELAKLKE